ncbi:MAG: hypothetical protein ACHQK9_15025, partial [Reyranellales bacterium]
MPTSSVVVRSLALAALGLGSASALAQTANVTAFDPYDGVGLPGSAAPASGRRGVPMIQEAVPAGGPAFNPWRPGGGVAGWGSGAPTQTPFYEGYYSPGYSPGANLPPPPPGPIQSRVVAIPQRGDAPGSAPPRRATAPPVALTAPAPEPTPTPAPPPPVATQPAAPAMPAVATASPPVQT